MNEVYSGIYTEVYNPIPHRILAVIHSKGYFFLLCVFQLFKETQLKYVYVSHLLFTNTYEAVLSHVCHTSYKNVTTV